MKTIDLNICPSKFQNENIHEALCALIYNNVMQPLQTTWQQNIKVSYDEVSQQLKIIDDDFNLIPSYFVQQEPKNDAQTYDFNEAIAILLARNFTITFTSNFGIFKPVVKQKEGINNPLPNDAVLNPDPIKMEEDKKSKEEEQKRQEELLDIQKELEAKYFIKDKENIRFLLKSIGLELIKAEFLMKRKTFNGKTEDGWIRVRDEGDKITLTFKQITGNKINDVSEIEIIVNDFEKASAIINQTSFKESSYQENYREIWCNDEVEIVIDTWPYLQSYIEIEAKSEDIVRKYSKLLNFDFNKEAFFGSVDVLYKKQFGISKEDFIKIPKVVFNDDSLFEQLNNLR